MLPVNVNFPIDFNLLRNTKTPRFSWRFSFNKKLSTLKISNSILNFQGYFILGKYLFMKIFNPTTLIFFLNT